MLSSQSYYLLVTVKAFGCMKITSVEDRSMSSRDLIRRKGFPNQMNSELELKSSEHKTYTECQKRKLCSDTEMSLEKTPKKRVSLQGRQRESEKELVVLKHHHSDYGRKDKIGKSVLRSKMDHTSNTNERVKEKLPVKLDKKSYRETEGAPRRVATIISSREQASIALLQPTKLPGIRSRANDSLERPTYYNSSRKIGCNGQVKSQRIKAESVQGKMHKSVKEMAYPLQSSNMNCSDVKMKLHSSDKNGSIVLPMLLYRSQGKKESSKDR